MQNFHRLFLAQQEMSDKMSSLSTSNGGQSSLNSTKQEIDFDNEEFDEKYSNIFPMEAALKSPSLDANFGSEIVGSSEAENKFGDNDAGLSTSGKFGSLERRRRNSRDLSPLPSRRKTDDITKEECIDKDDVFVKPRPPAGGRKGARRPLPLDFNASKMQMDERARQELSENVKRTQSW